MTITRLRGAMTQAELAKRAWVSRGYLAALEAGDKKNSSIAVLERLTKALDVSVAKLVK